LGDNGIGPTSLTKSGSGTWALTGTNTYTGGTTINGGGTLVLGNATNTLSDTGLIDIVSGTLSLGSNNDTVGNVILEGGSNISGTGGTLTSTNYDFRSGSVSANLAGTGTTLTKSTSGGLSLTGTNTYTGGTTNNGGDITFNNSSALGTGAIAFGPNGLDSMSLMSTAPVSLSNNIIINDLSATVGRTATLGSFSTASSGANAYTGNITLNNTLNLKSSSPTSNPLTFSSGTISGTGGLIMNPSGTISPGAIKLASDNTYAGATSIAAGTLLVTGGTFGSSTASGTGTGNVTVTGTGTMLAGGSTSGTTGTILGTVNIGSGSHLSPGPTGDGTGTTAILHTGALTLSSGSIYNIDINGTTAGSSYDQLISSSAMTFAGSSLVVMVGGALSLGEKFFILENSSALPNNVGTFTNGLTVSSGLYTFAIDYADSGDGGLTLNDISLTVASIPEPSTWIAGGLAFAALAFSQRRRFPRTISRC
jgi:autotransporter-associated beta strand protein